MKIRNYILPSQVSVVASNSGNLINHYPQKLREFFRNAPRQDAIPKHGLWNNEFRADLEGKGAALSNHGTHFHTESGTGCLPLRGERSGWRRGTFVFVCKGGGLVDL